MDPNQQPQNNPGQPQNPQPNQQPQASPQPQNPQQQPPIQQPTPPSPYVQQDAKPNKKSPLIPILIIGGIIFFILVLMGALAYYFVFSDTAHARRTTTEFMNAACDGDANRLIEITGEEDESAQEFLRSVATSVEGDCTLQEDTEEDNVWYYLYSIENAEANYARTSVENDAEAGWVVSSIFFSESELRLVPGSSNEVESSPETEETSNSEEAATTSNRSEVRACLANEDYRYMNFDNSVSSVQYDTTYSPDGSTFNYTASMFFQPDSTSETSLPSVYDDWAEFARENSDKQWVFRLRGSIYGEGQVAEPSSIQLANGRAEKVKSELLARGVPEDRIIIIEPNQYLNESQDDSLKEIYRRVEVIVDPTCDQR